MSCSPRRLLARPSLTVALVALFALVSQGLAFQIVQFQPGPAGPPPSTTDLAQLPMDREALKKLKTAQEYADAKLWAEAVRLLQAVVDLKEDSFIQIPADPATKTPERTCSSREEASRRIGALPPAGLEAYEIAYHDAAARMLNEAKGKHDPQMLMETVRRFRYTKPGGEALELLGAYALDRGEFDLAAVCYQRLLERSKDKPSKDLLFKAALAYRFAGNTSLEQQTLTKLADAIGGGTFKSGTRNLTADQLRAEVARLPVAKNSSEDTLVFRRDRSRRGAGGGDFPYLDPAVRIATVEEAASKSWLEMALKATPGNSLPLPSAVPIAVGDKVIYRSTLGVHAVDAKTGKEVWRTPSPLSLDSVVREPGKKVQMEHWFKSQYITMRNALYENSVLGTLSSDGSKVYAVEDLALPPHPNQIMMDQNGQKRYFGPLKEAIYHNKLRALDLATGAIAWDVGGTKGTRELAEAYFLGPPLPIGSNLFVLMEKNSELRLVCLRADRGEVLWTQSLSTPRDKILMDITRRIQAVHLAYDDGVLVCPTNSGIILGLDPMSRTLLWAHVYREAQPTNPDMPMYNMVEGLSGTWKGSAPIIAGGKVVFTATDSDSVRCLDLRTGALQWKILRTEEDLYVGTVRDGKVLLVGKNGSRMYSLANGSVIWQQQTDRPSGLGVAAGKYYYVPLEKGGLLALNMDNPKESAHLAAHSKDKAGNLVFYAGMLWSQDVFALTGYPEMTAYLQRVEAKLKVNGRDPVALVERAELRLDRGDVANAAADFHAALANKPSDELAAKAREKLYATLTQLLSRDFTAGEKYLDEYMGLCKVPVPADAPEAERQRVEAERQKRLTQYYILVAHGRASQGKLAEAVKAYRDLHERTRSDDLMAIPFDPAVQVRPERWVQTQIGVLVGQASDDQRKLLRDDLEREWRALSAANDVAALERFGALFGAIPGPVGAPGRSALFYLAERHVHDANPRYALDAELALHMLQQQADTPAFAARALETRARLLTRQGLLADAADCYRQLDKEYPQEAPVASRTGAQLFAELVHDKRFVPHLYEPRTAWVAAKLKAAETNGNFYMTKAPVSHEPHYANNPYSLFGNFNQMIDRRNPPPSTCRHLRFLIDVANNQLQVVDRDTGAERWSLSLPVAGARPYINDGNDLVCYRAVGHLAVFSVGQYLIAVDLIERRVRWQLNLLEGVQFNNRTAYSAGPDGSIYFYSNDGTGAINGRYGLVGPVSLTGCYVQTPAGLAALDLTTGKTRWLRSDVPTYFEMAGDDEYVYLVERPQEANVRGVRAYRVSDGVSVDIPDAVDAFAHRQRSIGRHVLVHDLGPREELIVRLYDVQAGKDLWKKTYPAGSLVLDGNTPDLVPVADSKGHVELLDPLTGKEMQRLEIDPKVMEKATNGVFLRDKTQLYVGFQLPKDQNSNVEDGPNPGAMGEIVSLPVNGMLFAYDRTSGKLRWGTLLKYQMIILDRFEEMPVVLCCSMTVRGAGPNGGVAVIDTRTVDKTTGKKLYHKEALNNGESFHTLQINARTGTIDFISTLSKVRFTMEK
jgi:outer membrane protein assembly factor BamB